MEEMLRLETIPPTNNQRTGWSCGEVAVIAAMKYLDPGFDLTEEKAEEITGKQPDGNTWPEQLVRLADAFPQFDATIHRTRPMVAEIYDYLRKVHSPEVAEALIKDTDPADFAKAFEHYKNTHEYKIEKITIETLMENIRPDQVVVAWVYYDILYEFPVKGLPHYVVMTGYDIDCVNYHESGGTWGFPVAHQRVSKKRFEEALGPDPVFIVWKRRA